MELENIKKGAANPLLKLYYLIAAIFYKRLYNLYYGLRSFL
jgi:hypothetical protein